MNRIWIFLIALAFPLSHPLLAGSEPTNDINTATEQQQMMVGGEQYVIIEGNKQRGPAPHASARGYYPDQTYLPYEKYQWQTVRARTVFYPEELYTMKEAEEKIGDYKWSGSFKMPRNHLPIFTLPGKAAGLNDIDIFQIEKKVPDGGIPRETFIQLMSIGKWTAFSCRMHMEIMFLVSPETYGVALGGDSVYSKIATDSSGWSVGVAPVLGWSAVRVNIPYHARITFYNNGPIPIPAEAAWMGREPSAGNPPVLEMINDVYFPFDIALIRSDQFHTLDLLYEYITQNWDDIIALDHVLILKGGCDVRGNRIYNLRLGKDRADNVRDHLAHKLAKAGYPAPMVKRILISASVGKDELISEHHKYNRRVKLYRAKAITRNGGSK